MHCGVYQQPAQINGQGRLGLCSKKPGLSLARL